MAQNQHRQRWQQPRAVPPPQQYYEQGYQQNGWTNGGRDRAGYGHGRPQQDAHNEYDGYGGYDAQSYPQDSQWQDQAYQEPPPGDMNGYGSSPQYQQGPTSGRNYNYDERFHVQGNVAGYPGNGQPQNYRPRAEKQRPPPVNLEHRRPKPRERILAQPVSPKEIAWDNPFPTFNTKKKGHRKNHSSLDKGMNKLDINGNSRPQTSQSHRRRDESRPHTSHSHRAPDGLDSPRLPQQPQVSMSPLRKDPPMKRDLNTPQQPYDVPTSGRNRPGPNPLHPHGMDMPSDSFHEGHMTQRMEVAPRSMTMPDNVVLGSSRRPAEPLATQHHPQQYKQQYGSPQDFTPVQKSRSHEYSAPDQKAFRAEPGFSIPGNGVPVDHQHNYNKAQQYASHGVPSSQGHQDMPNFDAIPASANERPDVHILPNPAPHNEQPAYQKKTYQAPGAFQPHLDTSKTRNPQSPSNELQSPLAEFSFGLSSNAPMGSPVSQSSAGEHGQQYSGARQNWNTNQQPPAPSTGSYLNGPSEETSGFPPRGTSRPEVQPRSASDAQQYPLTNPRGYQQQPRAQPQPPRPGTSQDSSGRDPRFDVFARRENLQQTRDQGYDNFQQRADRTPRQDLNGGYSQEPSQRFQRAPQNGMDPNQGQRPYTSHNARPPPVRHYDNPPAPDSQRTAFNSSTSPDALPAHPAPVRPGLAHNSDSSRAAGGANPMVQPGPSNQQQRAPSAPSSGQLPATDGKVTAPPVTLAELSSLQQTVRNNPMDNALGLRFAKKLVEAGSVLANEGGRADPKTTAKNRERYILDAHKQIKKLVSANYPDAMFYLADCYGQGLLGLAPDPKEAFHLYQSAAKLDHPQSAYRVAVCCEMGQDEGGGTRRDPMKAIQWYKRAAALGDTPAMYKMGMILLKGLLGQPRNPREALPWLKRAAERADAENPHALHELGLLYESASPNDNIVRDEKYALQLFMQASDLKYKYSQFRLGSAFEHGLLGCPIDPRQSISWYSKAAAQSEHQSELALSGWYLTGSDPILQQSDTEAYLWARKAAGSGLAKAEYAMGYYTEVGIGVTANLDEAKRWYYRAAAQNFPKARERLEDLKRGGGKMQKTRLSRSTVTKQNEGECIVM